MSLHDNIYNSFEDDTIFYVLKELKLDTSQIKYIGQIGYKEDNINIKFIYDTKLDQRAFQMDANWKETCLILFFG